MGESSVASEPAAVRVDLTGRSTLVTGAASGIGRAWAQRLCRAGAAVTVVDLNGDTARKVAAEISGEAMQADLSKHEVLDALEIEADIVVNNAGLQHVAAVEESPPERISTILRLMLEAPFRIVQKALPGMYEKGLRRINISSAHSLRASPFKSAYVSAKHGLRVLEGHGARGRTQRRDGELHLRRSGRTSRLSLHTRGVVRQRRVPDMDGRWSAR